MRPQIHLGDKVPLAQSAPYRNTNFVARFLLTKKIASDADQARAFSLFIMIAVIFASIMVMIWLNKPAAIPTESYYDPLTDIDS